MQDDRRRSPRLKSDHHFHVSRAIGNVPPPLDEFFPIEAYDISRDGIALITDIFHPGETIMLVLGTPCEHPAIVMAEVMHVTAMRFGTVFHPVTGCAFTERLSEELVSQFAQDASQGIESARTRETAKLWRTPALIQQRKLP